MIKLLVFFAIFNVAIGKNLDSFPSQRIIGGSETTIEIRPYQAVLLRKGTVIPMCGAAIITTSHLLTAAQCNSDVSLAVRVASTYTHKEGQYFFIKDIINHPQFERSTFDYDYAIVKVYGEIIMGIASQIIPLAASTAADPEVGSWFTIAGWGGAASSENEISFPIEFREIDLPLMDRNTCKNIYSDLTDRQLCLGENSEEASSPCFGDVGGPCVQNGVVYAIVSGENNCKNPKVSRHYARIAPVRAWIDETIAATP